MPLSVADTGNRPPVLKRPTLANHWLSVGLLGLKKHFGESDAMGKVFVSATLHCAMPGGKSPVASFQVLRIMSTPQFCAPLLHMLATTASTTAPPHSTETTWPHKLLLL
jgi:hypothetical protein